MQVKIDVQQIVTYCQEADPSDEQCIQTRLAASRLTRCMREDADQRIRQDSIDNKGKPAIPWKQAFKPLEPHVDLLIQTAYPLHSSEQKSVRRPTDPKQVQLLARLEKQCP